MKALGSSLVVILLATAGGPAHAQIYKWVDEAGKTHYSDTAPAGGRKVDTVADRISGDAPDPSIARAAATAGSDPALSDRAARLGADQRPPELVKTKARRSRRAASPSRSPARASRISSTARRIDEERGRGAAPVGVI